MCYFSCSHASQGPFQKATLILWKSRLSWCGITYLVYRPCQGSSLTSSMESMFHFASAVKGSWRNLSSRKITRAVQAETKEAISGSYQLCPCTAPLCSPVLPQCSLLLPRCSLVLPPAPSLLSRTPSIFPLKRPCSLSRPRTVISSPKFEVLITYTRRMTWLRFRLRAVPGQPFERAVSMEKRRQ